MASTGWITVASASAGGGWANAGNSRVEDGAEATSDQYSNLFNAGDGVFESISTTVIDLTCTPPLGINDGDTINGIEVQAKCRKSGGACSVTGYLIKNGVAVGAAKSLGGPGAGLAFLAAGGAADLWGSSWTAPDIKTKLHVGLYADPSSSGAGSPGNLYIDAVQFRITYTDSTPSVFFFTDVTNQPLSTLVTSDTISVSGMDVGATCSFAVSGGEYQKNGGAWTAAGSGTCQNGDTFTVRHTTSGAYGGSVNTILTLAGVIGDNFTSTTLVSDTTPDAFSFVDVSGLNPGAAVSSNSIQITGINAPTAFSIVNGSATINFGTSGTGLTGGNLNNNDYISVQAAASGAFATTVNVVVTIGGVATTWHVTTRAANTVPNVYVWTDVSSSGTSVVQTSNTIVLAGLEAACAISFGTSGTGTTHEYQKNGGAWTAIGSPPASMANGDSLAVRMVSPAGVGQTGNILTTIGTRADTFSVTTAEPAAFAFTTVNNANPFQLYVSNSLSPAVTAGRAISVVGGEYSLNGGAFTSGAGTFNIGDAVRVRAVSKGPGLSGTVSLTINGVVGTYTVNSGRGIGLGSDF